MVKQTIQIFCRVKPTKQRTGIYSIEEDEHVTKSNVEFVIPKDISDGFINNKRESYKFSFQKIFDQSIKQDDVFDHVAKGVTDNVLAGYNGTIFAYGQTGSGKTFTITGGVEKYADRGIIPRALSYLFQKYEDDKDHIYTTEVSYLEIYNESGYDLLDPRHEATKLEDLPKVALMEDTDQNITLKNLSILPAQNEEEALNLLFLGDTNRMIAETPMNQASTRSHCIFTIHITSREPGSATIRRSKLHLVDLAGSERVTKSQVGGQLLTEAKYINLSLHFLEQVIVALSDKKRQHIPYRNSMMTSVLRDSLGGNCMTTMIATVSVDKKNFDESISTCRFAQRVSMIKNEATLNEELDPKLMILKLKKEVQSLKDELSLVTGEQRTDLLTDEEIERLNNLLSSYLEDDDLESSLDAGGDMRKIQYCYRFLKKRIKERPDPPTNQEDLKGEKDASSSDEIPPQPTLSPAEIQRLREILQQRDNEISILVSMLKKEKKRAMDAEHRLATDARATPSKQASSEQTYNKNSYKDDDENLPEDKSRVKDLNMSAGRQEAFEIFKRDYGTSSHIHEQKELLKQRYAEAKGLGQDVNKARNEINHLKSSLERIRKQMAVQASLDAGAAGDDSFEEHEREQQILSSMEEAKTRYKEAFTRLKAMKAEIDHLHHLLDKARVQMQHEFDTWWQSQAPGGQQSTRSTHRSGNRQSNSGRASTQAWGTPPVSPHKRVVGQGPHDTISPPPSGPISPRESSLTHGRNALTDLRLVPNDVTNDSLNQSSRVLRQQRGELAPRFNPTSDLNSYHGSRPPSANRLRPRRPQSGGQHIPLTGDKETDADIMAFVKARESLMQRQKGHTS
ncbi:kinesin-like protein KIF6 [Clavelina lepadiformis]|uniref:kinesin-like protein KIF6 n=1 Tax=Clavelina lepadiformis TaxID=159417 RepID=UPI0040429CDB